MTPKATHIFWFFYLLAILIGLILLSSCSSIDSALIAELAKDQASFCARADTRGGLGSLIAPAGGYGQGTLEFCRSNHPGAKVILGPDGSITIEHK